MNQSFEWRSQSRLLDEVAQALRERIYAGVYAPGATLRQEKIAAEFGISRTPLREALRVLERDGHKKMKTEKKRWQDATGANQ